jgi:hypothetical protein
VFKLICIKNVVSVSAAVALLDGARIHHMIDQNMSVLKG